VSGHSKWSTIKRQKGVADARRGAAFTKLGSQIAIAAREGGSGDPEANFKLRLAIDKARQANMPKENIQRSIDRGLGKGGGAALESAIYEGFGPGGIAILVEVITDNRARTAAELRNVFERAGGNLGGSGATSYMFNRMGEIEIGKGEATFDTVFEKSLEAEAEDVEETPDAYFVYTKPEKVHEVKNKLAASGLPVEDVSLVFRPNKETMQQIGDLEKRTQVATFLETVAELDDVQEVYANG
jgi:YebC/PmpR family DNA-binding regulatory protein